jgi:hypothetical protein
MHIRALMCSGALLAMMLVQGQRAEAVTVPQDYPTIQAAINAVVSGALPDGTVIAVQPGTYNEALVINTTPRSLTVAGAGAGATIVNAASSGQSVLRVLSVTGLVQFVGLTFRGGNAPPGNGGGFTFQDASPFLTDVVFEGNTGVDGGGGQLTRSNAQFNRVTIRANTAARFGGGVVITTGSQATFTNCLIRDNVSGVGGPGVGSIGSGGGVHINDASVTFRGSVITTNQSKFAGGGITNIGLFNSVYGPSRLLLEDTEVSNNVTSRFSPSDNPAEGGGVHIEDNTVAYLIRAHVFGNSANTGGGLNGYRARYEITSSVVESNHAPDPLGVGGFGGGIDMTSNNISLPLQQGSSILLTDSVVRNNDSRVGAGILISGDQLCGSTVPSCNPATATRAALQIVQSLINSNAASLQGGGLRIDRTDATISSSHIFGNAVAAASGASYGGGVLLALGSNVTIQDTTIARNSSVDFGGGLFVDSGAALNLSSSRVYANSAGSGGGMYVGSIGPPSGIVQGSTLADNSNYQIHEQACSPLIRTILEYQNNTITAPVYFSTCGGATTSVAAFNALPSGNASGNTSGAPSFIAYLATPSIGPSVLSWSVSRASSVTISGLGTAAGDTSTANVAPTTSTTYTLTSNGGPPAPASRPVAVAPAFGTSTDIPVSGDFDGDGRKDLAVYRPSTGQWFILRSSLGFTTQTWGAWWLGDIPVPADYDGDGKTDIAVFRQATGEWFILQSSGGSLTVSWGAPALGDMPVAVDFDGDRKADIAVYRRSTGQWFIRKSSGGTQTVTWGAPSLGDIPVAADYDGDGRADVAVYRTATGQWFILRSSLGATSVGWGSPALGDTPVPADYDGDGKADVAVARHNTGDWIILRSSGGVKTTTLGFGDAQIPGDYDGVNHAETVIWRAASGSWLIRP